MEGKKRELIYLTMLVALFALFFFTFLLYNNADTACREVVDDIYIGIENDECMSNCLGTTYDFPNINYTKVFDDGFRNNS